MKNRSLISTWAGILTSVVQALAVLDLDTMDYSLPSTWIKIVLILLPAAGGYVSTIKQS